MSLAPFPRDQPIARDELPLTGRLLPRSLACPKTPIYRNRFLVCSVSFSGPLVQRVANLLLAPESSLEPTGSHLSGTAAAKFKCFALTLGCTLLTGRRRK